MNLFKCLFNLFRTNKAIPNPLPYYEMNKLEWKPDRIIIHNPTHVVSKSIVDMLNRLKIREAFEQQHKDFGVPPLKEGLQKSNVKTNPPLRKTAPPPPSPPPSRKLIFK